MNILPFAVALTAPQRNQATIIEALIPTMLSINSDQLAMFTAFSANEQATRAHTNQTQAVRSMAFEMFEAIAAASQSENFELTDEQLANYPNVNRLNLADEIAALLTALQEVICKGEPEPEPEPGPG